MSQTSVYQKFSYENRENVEYRRIVSGNKHFLVKILGAVLLFVLLLPYVITSLFGNVGGDNGAAWEKDLAEGNIYIENRTDIGRERIPLEIYLIDKLARSMNTDYHPEALRAQAVLLRTALIEELHSLSGGIRGTTYVSDPEYGRGLVNENVLAAVASTKGVILTYHDRPAKVAYFAVSNGRTRDGGEAFAQEELAYFKPVDCNRDFLAENFTSQKIMNRSEWILTMENKALGEIAQDLAVHDVKIRRDFGGYVIDLTIPASPSPIILSGEECRLIWGLNSSCFTIDESKNKIIFSVKGVGHGIGMSQYAANEMAKGENDYIAILEYFFSGTMLTKFE